MTEFAFGHALRIKAFRSSRDQSSVLYRFQNFFIGQTISYANAAYGFVPFGFSGVTVNRNGDGLDASLVFPNNDLTRSWSIDSINENWVMEVDVLIIDPQLRENADHQKVNTYTGQVTGGQWDNVSLNLQLGTVLDAVGTDVPRRSLTRRLVGNLPISNNVRLQ